MTTVDNTTLETALEAMRREELKARNEAEHLRHLPTTNYMLLCIASTLESLRKELGDKTQVKVCHEPNS